MVEITVKALDSASAMEEIQKKLGSDALIISTKKVDGQIEIVASNDDLSKYRNKSEPLILDSNFRVQGFSDILKGKMPNDRRKEISVEQKPNLDQIVSRIENIKIELDHLSESSKNLILENKASLNPYAELQIAGLRKSLFKEIGYLEKYPDFLSAAKVVAKAFVNGRCDHFERSKLYFVTGPDKSGKTLFSKKLKKFFENQPDFENLKPKIFSQIKVKKDFDSIRSWMSKINSQEIGIVEISNTGILDGLLLQLAELREELLVSVINVVSVGNSYEYIKRNIGEKRLEHEYLALTKLDLCDLSLQEISAFIENKHKCMFFSGISSEDEGLFFAKVDKIVSHIVKTIENEVG